MKLYLQTSYRSCTHHVLFSPMFHCLQEQPLDVFLFVSLLCFICKCLVYYFTYVFKLRQIAVYVNIMIRRINISQIIKTLTRSKMYSSMIILVLTKHIPLNAIVFDLGAHCFRDLNTYCNEVLFNTNTSRCYLSSLDWTIAISPSYSKECTNILDIKCV